MNTAVSTAFEDGDDAREVGERVAESALAGMDGDRVDCWMVFADYHLEYESVLAGVRSVVGHEAASIGTAGDLFFSDGGTSSFHTKDVLDMTASNGVCCCLIASDTFDVHTAVVDDLDDGLLPAVRTVVGELPSPRRGYGGLIQVSDPGFGNTEELTLRLHQRFGPTVKAVGGCAQPVPSFDDEPAPVSANSTVAENGLAVALIDSDRRLSLGIGHGHEPMEGPFTVTESDGRKIHELDGRPTYECWKEVIRADVADAFDLDIEDLPVDELEHFRIQSCYPFGIHTGDSYKCRSTGFSHEEGDGTMEAGVRIPEGTELWILKATNEAQGDCVADAARQITTESPDLAGAILFDCACRWALTQTDYDDAVETLAHEFDVPYVGHASGGQICMYPGDMTGYHDITTVGLGLPK